VVAMFLALLEMVRLQAVLLRQDRAFSDIFIKRHTGFDAVIDQGLATLWTIGVGIRPLATETPGCRYSVLSRRILLRSSMQKEPVNGLAARASNAMKVCLP